MDSNAIDNQRNAAAGKPEWLKVRAPSGEPFYELKRLLRRRNLHTVCEEARCPNIGECWRGGTATFMILGDTCTRGCRFCAVKTAKRGLTLDPQEPKKIADAVHEMGLDYVVLTSVDRDDLADQGSAHFAATVAAIKAHDANILVECLIPDFRGELDCLDRILAAQPDVLAHNVETVPRLTKGVRDPRATYEQSLAVLRAAKKLRESVFTKSSIMVGLGETSAEVLQTMRDLRAVSVDILTVGQYLQPTKRHLKVAAFVHPELFAYYKAQGEALGFRFVASGPLVRSSYRAGEFFVKNILRP